MKKMTIPSFRLVLLALVIGLFSINSFAQSDNEEATDTDQFPNLTVYDLDGSEIKMEEVVKNDGKPVVVDFWATWCKPCIMSIGHMHEQYAEWQEKYGVKIVLISIDDKGMESRITRLKTVKGWEFDIYHDKEKGLMKALQFNQVPQTYLLKDGKIIWHEEFAPGEEDKLEKQIKKAAK